MKILLLSLALLILVGCDPNDPNQRTTPITVRDVEGICWQIVPTIAMEGMKALHFTQVPCP